MADLLGTTFSVGNGLSQTGQSNSDLLVQAFKRTKQSQIDALNTRKSALESRQLFFNKLRTRLDNLKGATDTLLDSNNAAGRFVTRKATSSDASIISIASTTSDALPSTSTVKVNRLATSDTLISARKTLADTAAVSGAQTFTLNGKSIAVNIDAADTNEKALAKIVSAVNGTSDLGITAAVVKDTASTARLTFTSKETGASNQINFSDSALLADLGITTAAVNPGTNARTLAGGPTQAGFRTANFENLDAKMEVNGVEVTRGKNTVDDVFSGVTLTLNKAQADSDQPTTITTAVDADGLIDKVIRPFMDAFNEAGRFLRSDPNALRADSSLRTVSNRFRTLVSENISSTQSGNPNSLSEIGIKINDDGTLSVSDKTKLQKALEANPQQISDLFISSDGIASKVRNAMSNVLGDNGLINARTTSLRSQITQSGTRIKDMTARVDRQADALRKQYEDLQNAYLKASNQYGAMRNLVG
jgi:flagellar hook-associated protein 2